MENFELQEKLRAFAAGELTQEEKMAVQKEAAQSPEVMEELRFSQKLTQALKHKDLLEVNGIIGGILASEGLPPTTSTGKGGAWNGFLLSLLILGVLSTSVYFIGNQLNWWQSREEKLVQEFLEPMENVLFTEQTGMAADDLRLGMDAYDQQDYGTAIRRLENYYNRTKDANAGLFLSISYLLEHQPVVAMSVLNKVTRQLNGPAQEAAQWYLALAHLQNDDAELAKTLLKNIPSDGLYGTSAQQLLQELK